MRIAVWPGPDLPADGVRVEVTGASAQSAGPTPGAVWAAVLEGLRAALAGGAAPTSIELASSADVLALWDVETLGSPSGLLLTADLGRLAEREPHTWRLALEGRYAVGTLAAYLLARATRGLDLAAPPTHLAALTHGDLPDEARPEPWEGSPLRAEPACLLGLDVALTLADLDGR